MNKDKIIILILAAGRGTRMKSEEPKALTKLKGKPFLHHILETIKKLDLKIKPFIVVGYKKETIKEMLGDEASYVEQREQLGTGHAVMSAKNSIVHPHEMVLVLSADQPTISVETLEKIITTHLEKRPAITIGTVVVPDYEDWRIGLYSNFGRIVRGSDGKVEKIVEFKNTTPEEKLIKEVNPALYLFDADWLWKNIDRIEMDKVKGEYKLTDMINLAFKEHKKIEAVPVINVLEGLQPNSKEELEILEKLMVE
jgi:bifunctional UDP-N-acetylglucosamine pyrophosphorylase/glucosamine-1-phosphate N-acetyltransferase